MSITISQDGQNFFGEIIFHQSQNLQVKIQDKECFRQKYHMQRTRVRKGAGYEIKVQGCTQI